MGISTHPISSFNESSSTRLLSEVLESKKTIKTFFKENDRTPNYDGSFELVDKKFIPQKQFIVQIKKVENLEKSTSGKNKGKYVYQLETPFLFYVKEKVTESPAIYFVVDICTRNIFWVYLSDEFLMNLNFENNKSGKIAYAFSEENKLLDIDVFTQEITEIARKRNELFLNKTPEEIEKLQDAVDYLNYHINTDFQVIKKHLFPNLWRFGIRCSHTPEFKMFYGDNEIASPDTAMYALYPQIKSVPDTGIREYNNDKDNLFNTFDMLGKKEPISYAKESLTKIIELFFENGIPYEYMPNIVLFEQLNVFAKDIKQLYHIKELNEKMVLGDLSRALMLMFKYTQHILVDDLTDEIELRIREIINRNYMSNRRNFFDMASTYRSTELKPLFEEFCAIQERNISFSPDIFKIVKRKYIKFFLMIQELSKRKVTLVDYVWDYNYYELTKLDENTFINKVDEICKNWFEKLPSLYNETFDRLFTNEKYRYLEKIEYKNEYYEQYPFFSTTRYKYGGGEKFIVEYNEACSEDFSEEKHKQGVKSIGTGFILHQLIDRKTMFYDSITYLLYKGVCRGLDIKAGSLSIDGNRVELF